VTESIESTRPRAFFDNAPAVQQRVAVSSHVSLFLDFDGTISNIVSRPGDATISPAIRSTVETLVARPDFTVAIVSGRSLNDVRERAALGNVIYAGNHGLEIEAGSARFREPRAEVLRREIRCLSLQLQMALSDTDGLEIEDKGLTLSVHFRRVHQHFHDWVRSVTSSMVARSRSFVCREGKMVLEVRPQIDWHKGYAVKWILREILPFSSLPIYIGDDTTDEDAFAALPDGIRIRVGDSDDSKAEYFLSDVAAVGQFLRWLNQSKALASFATSQRSGR
jgi:trehalose 6-phosphate phosphatase